MFSSSSPALDALSLVSESILNQYVPPSIEPSTRLEIGEEDNHIGKRSNPAENTSGHKKSVSTYEHNYISSDFSHSSEYSDMLPEGVGIELHGKETLKTFDGIFRHQDDTLQAVSSFMRQTAIDERQSADDFVNDSRSVAASQPQPWTYSHTVHCPTNLDELQQNHVRTTTPNSPKMAYLSAANTQHLFNRPSLPGLYDLPESSMPPFEPRISNTIQKEDEETPLWKKQLLLHGLREVNSEIPFKLQLHVCTQADESLSPKTEVIINDVNKVIDESVDPKLRLAGDSSSGLETSNFTTKSLEFLEPIPKEEKCIISKQEVQTNEAIRDCMRTSQSQSSDAPRLVETTVYPSEEDGVSMDLETPVEAMLPTATNSYHDIQSNVESQIMTFLTSNEKGDSSTIAQTLADNGPIYPSEQSEVAGLVDVTSIRQSVEPEIAHSQPLIQCEAAYTNRSSSPSPASYQGNSDVSILRVPEFQCFKRNASAPPTEQTQQELGPNATASSPKIEDKIRIVKRGERNNSVIQEGRIGKPKKKRDVTRKATMRKVTEKKDILNAEYPNGLKVVESKPRRTSARLQAKCQIR